MAKDGKNDIAYNKGAFVSLEFECCCLSLADLALSNVSTLSVRELKHRTMKEQEESKFQLQEYVDKEMRTAGCCRS